MTTPAQTVGPFLSLGLDWPDGPSVVPEGAPGAVWLRGRMTDGAGEPVPDGMVETWQADAEGSLDGTFRGFGRALTDADGQYGIRTVKPGRVDRRQAPHVDVAVLARGLLHRVFTRIYFADEPEANAADPVLGSVADEAARATLLAEPTADGYRFDIVLQGPDETVFFAV